MRAEFAACMLRNNAFYFGQGEGVFVQQSGAFLAGGRSYEAPRQGVTLFLRRWKQHVPCGAVGVMAGLLIPICCLSVQV
jgi:hypothetical protein